MSIAFHVSNGDSGIKKSTPIPGRLASVYSEVQKSRLDVTLPLPSVLISGFKVVEGPLSSAAGNPDEIAKLFPNLYGQPSAVMVPSESGGLDVEKKLKIGVVLSGGQAPGGHNVISGIFDYLQQRTKGSTMYGFKDGPAGIMKCNGRDKIETPEQFKQAQETAIKLDLDGLVVIDGEFKDQQEATYNNDDEADDSIWEDGSVPDIRFHSNISNNNPDGASNGMVIDISWSEESCKKKQTRRVSVEEKEIAENVHKVNLLCLLARGRLVDKACDDCLIQAAILSLLPKGLHEISELTHVTINHLVPIVEWFQKHFSICPPRQEERPFHASLTSALEASEGTPEEIAGLSVASMTARKDSGSSYQEAERVSMLRRNGRPTPKPPDNGWNVAKQFCLHQELLSQQREFMDQTKVADKGGQLGVLMMVVKMFAGVFTVAVMSRPFYHKVEEASILRENCRPPPRPPDWMRMMISLMMLLTLFCDRRWCSGPKLEGKLTLKGGGVQRTKAWAGTWA